LRFTIPADYGLGLTEKRKSITDLGGKPLGRVGKSKDNLSSTTMPTTNQCFLKKFLLRYRLSVTVSKK
jgi:hypothetical protein